MARSTRGELRARRRTTGAALVFFLVTGGCRGETASPKPTIEQAWAAAKLPTIPRGPVIPARRTVVLPVPPRQDAPDDPALVALGKKIFFDARLSEPAGTSCASCHDPARGFSGSHGSRIGVPRGSRPGHFARRSTPSVMYLRYVPRFHYFEDDEAPAPEPRGGFFWDGRSDSLAELVEQPLFNPDEMNAGTAARVAGKVARGPYGGEFRAVFGEGSAPEVMRGLGRAVAAFLRSDEMNPTSSRFDGYVRGEVTLTEQERAGLEVFKDRRRGACAGCHRVAETSTNPAESMFTDYGYDAIALPRNRQLPASARGSSFDLGLCERREAAPPGATRPRATMDERFCSAFRTPSLRNVALRESFGHNGVYKTLRDMVAFYARRAVSPGRIYPAGDAFDDVPPRYRGNINIHAPVYNRPEGGTPPLTEAEIDAVVAFLNTLTDERYVTTTVTASPPSPPFNDPSGGGRPTVAQSPDR